jgi:hypothetical protein
MMLILICYSALLDFSIKMRLLGTTLHISASLDRKFTSTACRLMAVIIEMIKQNAFKRKHCGLS